MIKKEYDFLLKFAFFSILPLFIFEIYKSSIIPRLLDGSLSQLKILYFLALFCFTLTSGFLSFFYSRLPLIKNVIKSKNPIVKLLIFYCSFQIILFINFFIPSVNPSAIIIRSRPLFIWFFILSSSVFWLESVHFSLRTKMEKIFITSLLILDLLLIGYYTIFPNSITFRPSSEYLTWNQGLFVLWLIFSLEFVIKFLRLKEEPNRYFLLLICLLLFLTSSSLWGKIEFYGSYNMVGPFRPGSEWFPHSDSTRFDIASQSILIGEGINFHNYSDNPLMVFYMLFLHLLGGGSFNELANIQVWIFSLVPIVIFLVALKSFGFSCGLASSLLYIFRVCNFLSNTRNTGYVSPRIFLSEGILEPLIMLMVLCVIMLFLQKKNNYRLVIILGGLFSLSALVRANVWFLLPLFIILFFLLSEWSKKIKLANSIIFVFSICLFLMPWMYRSSLTINTPFFFLYKFQHSILEERYNLQENQIYRNNSQEYLFGGNPESISIKSNLEKKINIFTLDLIQKLNIIQHILSNFFLNIWMSIRLIPNLSLQLSNWSFGIILSYIISGIILFLGFAFLYKSKKIFFSFLGVYVSYIIASSFALTSGARYSQPVEWIFLLVYSVGISGISRISFTRLPKMKNKLVKNEDLSKKSIRFSQNFFLNLSIIFILFLSLSVLIMDYFPNTQKNIPSTFDENSKNNVEKELCKKNSQGIIPERIEGEGRIIYSLSLTGDKIYDHEIFIEKPYLRPSGYDMLALFVINSDGGRWILINMLQQDWPKESLVWKDIFYYGCENGKTINVYNGLFFSNTNKYEIIKSNPKITSIDGS